MKTRIWTQRSAATNKQLGLCSERMGGFLRGKHEIPQRPCLWSGKRSGIGKFVSYSRGYASGRDEERMKFVTKSFFGGSSIQ